MRQNRANLPYPALGRFAWLMGLYGENYERLLRLADRSAPPSPVTAHCDIEALLQAWNNEYVVLGYGAHLYDDLVAFCEVTGIKAYAL